jgi:4-amino-4-deoxy-L-arabinose transferase-like glycosyltransferase
MPSDSLAETKMYTIYRSRFFLPVLLSFVMIAVVTIYYWTLLPVGHIQHGDEYLTLDRSNSFVIRGDYSTVFSNNRPTFKKPPLQYWMTAALMRNGSDLELALRFPSFLFGILTLINVGFLAYLLYPANPWVTPAAIALLAGSSSFWGSNVSALLDSGAALFSTMAITACLLAFSRPRWWYLAALAIGLAAWQKAAIPLLLVGGMVLFAVASKKYHQVDIRHALLNRHFWAALGAALAAVFFWPVFHWVSYGAGSFQEAYVGQMVDRFSPFSTETGGGIRRSWHTVLLASEPVLRVPAILALIAMPWVLGKKELLALPLLLAVFVVGAFFATGYVSPRYSLIFLPLLMAALAVVLVKSLPGKVLPTLLVAALAVSKGGPIRSAKALGLLQDDQEKYFSLLQGVGTSLRPEEMLVVCRPGPANARIAVGAFSYYASAGRPFHEVRSATIFQRLENQGALRPPYRGLCHKRDFEGIKPLLSKYEIVEEANEYIHWTAN